MIFCFCFFEQKRFFCVAKTFLSFLQKKEKEEDLADPLNSKREKKMREKMASVRCRLSGALTWGWQPRARNTTALPYSSDHTCPRSPVSTCLFGCKFRRGACLASDRGSRVRHTLRPYVPASSPIPFALLCLLLKEGVREDRIWKLPAYYIVLLRSFTIIRLKV